ADGGMVVSASDDRTIRFWDVRAGTCTACWDGLASEIVNLKMSRDGRRLVGRSWDEVVHVWDIETNRWLETLPGRDGLEAIAEGPARYPLRARTYSVETAIERATDSVPVAWFPNAMRSIHVSSCGRVWAGAAGSEVYIFTLEGEF